MKYVNVFFKENNCQLQSDITNGVVHGSLYDPFFLKCKC